jgi:alpha-D-ribose 1-methylphosphonate 5-triphosphate synthase subunit PhnG
VRLNPHHPRQARNTTVAQAELRALEERLGALEWERGALLDDQEALLVGLQSVEAEAGDHGERLALLEAEVGRLAAVEARIGRLGLQLVRAPSTPPILGCACV